MGICAKNYKNLPSRFFMGINGLRQPFYPEDKAKAREVTHHPFYFYYLVDNFGTVVGENPDCLLLSGTVFGENPDHVCWVFVLDTHSVMQISH